MGDLDRGAAKDLAPQRNQGDEVSLTNA